VKNVVCIGGGTGLSTLLRGIKKYCDPAAIVSMADSGGHSGKLRDEFGMLPPGDVRACLVALADDDKSQLLRELFNYRFMAGSYTGANVGNLLLTALSDILGDFNQAVEAAHDLLGLHGTVVPVTLESTDLLAELEDGTILFGEKAIDVPRKNGHVKLKRIWLQPRVPANPKAIDLIHSADVIIFSPGDLYTSILPNLLVDGIRDAIAESSAHLVYVSNIMTKHGETDHFTVEDFVAVIEQHCGRPLDTVIYNNQEVPAQLVTKYQHEHAIPVVALEAKPNWRGEAVLSTAGNLARHNSKSLAKALAPLLTEIAEAVHA
jgi:uncharacterized cofD-like protein